MLDPVRWQVKFLYAPPAVPGSCASSARLHRPQEHDTLPKIQRSAIAESAVLADEEARAAAGGS
ncbi:hypothetical protein JW992_09205 [candidate division KSB1 bacterium]|nr:hypothetical protein [candidate division KSB1 bacterium]